MKLYLLIPALFGTLLSAQAQNPILSVGSTTSLTIKTGTIFSADSLVLIPGTDYTLSSNNIQISHIPVPLTPNPSIDRVYYLNTPISFTGTIQLYYQLSELNGLTEGSLKYTDSTVVGVWQAQATSTVNTVSHFVQFATASQLFNGSTASGPIAVLLISLVSFSGTWDQEYPMLQWVIDQSDQSEIFNVQSSSNATGWKSIGQIGSQEGNGTDTYQYNDLHPLANDMYYRIQMIDPSGRFTYSNVLELQKAGYNNGIRLTSNGNTVSVYFSGTLPACVRFINTLGQVLKTDMASKQEYALSGLTPGVYFMQYELNGQWGVRKFVVE